VLQRAVHWACAHCHVGRAVRQRLSEEGYRILVNIGDQESDLAGGYAEFAVKLPNYIYSVD
jgi:hypothetical protein